MTSVIAVGATAKLIEPALAALETEGTRVHKCSRTVTDSVPAGLWRLDVTDRRSIDSAFGRIRDADSNVQYLLYASGVSHSSRAASVAEADFDEVMKVNLAGYMQAVGAFLQHFPKASGIVAIGSVCSERTIRGTGLYSASKAAMTAYTRVLAEELAASGIRANVLSPGFFHAGIGAPIAEDDRLSSRYLRRIGADRFGHADELTGAVQFLCSEASSYMTGTTLEVNGGFL